MRLPAPEDLPKVSFRRIDDDLSKPVVGVSDALARSFGYCDGSDFERPVHYIRHTETLENDLLRQVEYDMDEQDLDWLAQFNIDRRKEQADPVSPEVFEVILDQLEKEWFLLMKRVPKPDMDLPAEDSTCAVCDDGEGENSNAIVFCDGCNLAVHQDCYGVPYIPEGQWLCRKCTVSPETPVGCVLCPNEGGAFKQTGAGKWAHLLCAIWIPEVVVTNQLFMEPIDQTERIPKTRWRLRCTLCKESKGACIQCNLKSCFAAFHVTCARKAKLLCTMKTLPGQEEQPLRAYCERHLPKDMQAARSHMLESLEQRTDEQNASRKSTKAARAYARTYKTGPPLVPAFIVDKMLAYISKVSLRKKNNVVLSICKYWSLKREARRGAPLLKRLHLEPWTATPTVKQQTDEDRKQKLDHLEHIRDDLETVRELIERVQKREREKVKRVQNVADLLANTLFPHEADFRHVLERIAAMDTKDKFRQLPSRHDNPEYYEKVPHPISWIMIDEKLDCHDYWDLDEFKADINRVFDNAITFYPHEHELNRTATRFKRISAPILNSLDRLPHYGQAEDQYVLGQLEPHLNVVNLFFDTLAVQTNMDIIMNKDPISSLISDREGESQFSLPPHLSKGPALQSSSAKNAADGVDPSAEQSISQEGASMPPSPTKPKRIRDRKAERERREQKLAAQAAQAAENAGKLASPVRSRRSMATRSTVKDEDPVAAEPTAAPPPAEDEKPDISIQTPAPQPVEPASVSSQSVDPPAQSTHTSTSQPNVLPLRPKVALPAQTPKQEPSMSPKSPAPFQPPHVEYAFHHWAPQSNLPPRAPEPQPERHFQPDFQPMFHHSQQHPAFPYDFSPPQPLPMYHQQTPHSNSMYSHQYSHQYQQPSAHHQSLWLNSALFPETSRQHQPPNAFSIEPSFRPVTPRQIMQHPTYSSPQTLPRNAPIVTPTLLPSSHFSRYAAPIPSTPTQHLPPAPESNPNQFQAAGMAGASHQLISIAHPAWTPLSQPSSPDRDGKKRKRSEYEVPIQIPAVLESVDKKDEFVHFEQGWVLPEGSRRSRQGPVTLSRIDPTAGSSASKPPERRATSDKKSHTFVSVPHEPHVNRGENLRDHRSEKKMSKSEKLKLRKLKDKERNQRRRDQAKKEREGRVAVATGGELAFLPGQSQGAEAGPDGSAPGTANGEIGAEEQLRQLPVGDLFDGETSSLSSLSDSEEDRPPTTADTQASAPTDGYGTATSRGSTLSPLPPSPPRRMSARDRRGKFSSTGVQAQDHKDVEDAIIESEQSKEPSGRNRSRAALGSSPEAGPDGKLEGGTLVWAKQEGHPWFPAVIHDGTEEEIPARVQEARMEVCSTMTPEERNTLQVVRFYDKAFNWGYVPLKWIRLLFEDDARDKYLLNGKFRNHTVRSQVRAAFRRAVAEKAEAGGEDDAEEEHVDN